MHIKNYEIFRYDKGISSDIVGEMITQFTEDCAAMCMSHGLCISYSHRSTTCTLASKHASESNFTTHSSPGEHVYSGEPCHVYVMMFKAYAA